MSVEITLNGETKRLDAPTSVRWLLEGLGLDPAKIAVERNLAIVPRSTYDVVMVAEGDKFEIVHFIGGGNARYIKFALDPNIRVVSNDAGITGGIRLWDPRLDPAFTAAPPT